ncbi:MAG TPA: penicillin-insensitive murein endopeptidase [Pseudolabrys sp.]|nr:penicillin-insensitive murein endopeptidase [Pseudolabrys sp.]
MRMRLIALFGVSVLMVAGLLGVAERASIAQSPPQATQDATPPAVATPAPSQPTPPAPPAPAASPAPAVQAPAPVVTAPAAETPAPVVTAPPSQTPEPVVTAPVAPAPAPVVTAPAPLPEPKPAITEAKTKEGKEPAKQLFAEKKLPSIGKALAIGYYPRGCLQGAVPLPVTGKTWQVMRLSRNRNWGHPELVKFLERFAPAAAKATGWHGILVGDMAQPRGGPLPFGHTSHQIGLDVDIWFMPMPGHTLSKDEREKTSAINLVADDWKHVNPKTWSPADVAFIRTAAEQPEVERVLVNAAIKKEMCRMQGDKHPSWMDKVRPWYGHHDHIHVRLKCPADSPHCRKQPSVPESAGCGEKDLAFWFSDKVLHPKKKVGGKPPKPLMLADLPPACKNVLDAPAKTISAGVSEGQ